MLRSRWTILALLFWIRAAMGFQFQSVGSIATPLAADLAISAAALGALIGLYILPGFIAAIPGGALSARLPDRMTAAIGLLIMALGSAIMAVAPSFVALCAGRLVAGVGYALFTLVITKMVAEWFAGREMLAAMGVMLASWPAGIALGLAIQPLLAVTYDWRLVQWSVAAVCITDALLTIVLYRSPIELRESKAASRQWPSRRETALVLASSLAWGCLNIGLIILFSFAPRFLEGRGFATAKAAALISIGLWVSTVSIPLGGALAERFARPLIASAVWCVVAAGALLMFTLGGSPALFSALIGVSLGVPAAVMIALPARLLRPESLALGLGLFYAAYFAQMMLGPLIAGMVADMTDNPAGALWVGVIAFLVGGAIIGWFQRGVTKTARPLTENVK